MSYQGNVLLRIAPAGLLTRERKPHEKSGLAERRLERPRNAKRKVAAAPGNASLRLVPRSPKTRIPALLRAAALVRERAHAPYSKYPVGAAVLAGGRIFAGCNVENSAYPLSVCAERNAMAMAVAAGFKRIDAVAVVGGNHRPSAPCGGCRQVLAEFAAEATPVVYASADGETIVTTIGELLPSAFSRSDVIAAAPVSTGTRVPAPPTRSRAASGKDRSAAPVRGTRSSGR